VVALPGILNKLLIYTDHGWWTAFYPDLYTQEQDGNLPAETLYELKEGDNAGWPSTHYDQNKNKRVLALNMVEMGIREVMKNWNLSGVSMHLWP
jgi:glucose/arabinose dehydrogenase